MIGISRNKKIIYISVSIIVIVLVSELAIYSNVLRSNFKYTYKIENKTLIFQFNVFSWYPMHVHFLALEKIKNIVNNNDIKVIYVYYDKNLPMYIRKANWGLINHLHAEINIRNKQCEIKMIDINQLKEILIKALSKKISYEALVLNTEGINNLLHSLGPFLKKWVEEGGILFYILGHTSCYNPLNFLFTQNIFSTSSSIKIAFLESFYSQRLNILYPYISNGIKIKGVNLLGGQILGKTGFGLTSIAVIPIGHGNIVIFSGNGTLKTLEKISKDIAQIIISNIFNYKIISYKKHKIDRFKTNNFIEIIDLATIKQKTITIYIFQIERNGSFFKKISIPIFK